MCKVQVFDPAMCCSTGVCGPGVDPELVRFASDVEWFQSQGVEIERNNLSGKPQAFADNELVRKLLHESGTGCLPLTLIDGAIAFQGEYPTRPELAARLGLESEAPRSIYSEAVTELVAIGAAIASNCEPCFRYHYDQARKLGVSREDMWAAVETAKAVKDQSSGAALETAARYLTPAVLQKSGECCGSDDELPMLNSKGCC